MNLAGTDRVDAYLVWGIIPREVLGERCDCRFGNIIGDMIGSRVKTPLRSSVDNCPASRLDHVWNDRPAQIEHRIQVDGEAGMPIILRKCEQIATTIDAGIVGQDVHAAASTVLLWR